MAVLGESRILILGGLSEGENRTDSLIFDPEKLCERTDPGAENTHALVSYSKKLKAKGSHRYRFDRNQHCKKKDGRLFALAISEDENLNKSFALIELSAGQFIETSET